jgi:L-threonylcarbamoyladenylate synthase
VAPSANISGRPSPTTAQHVYDDLNGRIDCILDAGPTRIGIESTVLDITQTPPLILRKGGLSKEAIEAVIGNVGSEAQGDVLKRSPGNRYKHYSPRAGLILVKEGDAEEFSKVILDEVIRTKKIGCILHSIPDPETFPNRFVRRIPPDVETISHMLFEMLREFDKSGVDIIVVEEVPDKGLGMGVMDRLRRAAAKN